MLIDHRTYTVKPGTMAKQLALYQEYGLVPQKRHLGEPLAYLITESGEVNTYVHIWVGSYRIPGWWIASRDEGANQGPEQSFSAAACVMHELKEAEIKRQLVLRDTTVRAQPGPQQRPEAFNRVDVDLAEAITVFVACILTAGMAHRLVAVAPSR
jgi:NIPSNAP